MRKLGVSLLGHKEIKAAEQIKMIKEAGFDCFFFEYKDATDIDLIRNTADQVGLEIETAHLPFGGANKLWEEGKDGDDFLQSLCDKISGCQRIGVDKAIVHGPLTLELGLKGRAEYSEMPLQEFFNDAYRRAQKLLSMVNGR